MKAKIYSRAFAVILSASIIASTSAVSLAAVAEENTPYSSQSVVCNSSGSSIPTFAMDAFNNAIATYQGGTLTPLACYGEQVVAGYNFRFICRMNSNSQDDLNSLKFVTVYQNPQNVSTISEVSDFSIADYEEDYNMVLSDYPANGSMEVISGLTACELPEDAQAVFDSLYENIVGVSNVPIAFLGKKTNNGTDYVYLCERSAVVPNPDIYIDVLILHKEADGTTYQKSSYSILGTRTNYENISDDDGKLTYEFKGNFKDTAGYAEGKITLNADRSGTYKLYWADNYGALDGYYPIKEMTLKSGESGSVSLGYHTVIPANATKIIAVTDSLNTSDAYSVFTIPIYKRFSSASGDFLYSFSTYSDIHIDKGSLWYVNAEKNFKQALKYSDEKNTDFIVVSGDCVTNDSGPDKEWKAYEKIISESDYVNPIWESDGNHDLRQDVSSGLKSFIKGSGTDGSQSGKSYFSMIEPTTGDLFIFMSIELDKSPNKTDVFSNEQLAWVSETIRNNYNDRNIFIVQHSPIKGYGAGDRMDNPYYGGMLNPDHSSTKQFKALLEQYPNVMFLSGHTHEDFTMDYNYSDENGTSANMIHTPSLAGSTMPNSSDNGLERNGGKGFNSQGYYIEVYENEIVFYGANITDEKIYPNYSYIMEGSRTSESLLRNPQEDVPLLNNTVDITQELAKTSYVLSQYYQYASYDSYQWLKKLYYIHKGETTADESVMLQFEDAITSLSTYTGHISYNPLYKTYYFRNNKKWDNVYLYAWTGSSSNASWPGKKLEKIGTNESGEGIYSVTFNTVGEYRNIIFSSGSNTNQTVDIALRDYEYNGFYISGSSDGKYKVGNFDYNGETPPEEPVVVEHETHDDMALIYYIKEEHDWSDHSNLLTYVKNGIYKISYDATSDKTFSFSLYDKTTKKYYSLEESKKPTYSLGETFKYTVKEMSSRGSSVSIYGLYNGAHIDIEYNSNTKEITVICPQPEPPALINNSNISADTIKLGESVTLNALAEGGTAPYTYNYYFKQDSEDEWSRINVLDTAVSAAFKPDAAAIYNVSVVVTDYLGKMAEKSFNITVNPATLKNESTVSASNVNVGTSVKINGLASGGVGNYTYEFYYKKQGASSWSKFGSSYQTATTATLKAASAGTFIVRTYAKDGRSASVKDFTIKFTAPLANNTTVTSTNPAVGTAVTIKGAASGGTGNYTYQFYYKRQGASSWSKFGSSYQTATTATLKASSAGTFIVRTYAKDGKSSVVKDFTITFGTSALSNKTTVTTTTPKVGTAVTIKGAASGGTGTYTYEFYYKRQGASSWSTFGANYRTDTTATLKASSVGSFDVRVYVKDSSGKASVKNFTITYSK